MKKENGKQKNKKSIVGEFKEFISRGSVMDLAVGIIIGSAFTAIVSSLVNDIITPLVGMIIGGLDFTALTVALPSLFPDHQAVLSYGNFIQAVINFFIIAVCVFMIIKTLNALKAKTEQEFNKIKNTKEEIKTEEPKEEKPDFQTVQLELLTEIRDLLRKNDD